MLENIKTKFQGLKMKFVKRKEQISTTFLALSILLMTKVSTVFAIDTSETLSSGSGTQIQGMMVTATKKALWAIGGGCVVISLGIVAIKMIMAHKREETRTEAIASIGWILGGVIILGGLLIAAGFLWNGIGGVNS